MYLSFEQNVEARESTRPRRKKAEKSLSHAFKVRKPFFLPLVSFDCIVSKSSKKGEILGSENTHPQDTDEVKMNSAGKKKSTACAKEIIKREN